jgi:SepF-like predicted cell division protein (DUF552 family)
MTIKITGLDELQRQFGDAQKAFEALDGEIGTLRFDPSEPGSIDAAIREMEEAIDVKAEPYQGNPLVAPVVEQMKETYRAAIFERIEQARLENKDT